jgi:DNA-binding IclR family transcriptional regulator
MPTQPTRSVQRAAQILKVLAAAPEADLSLSEIARAVGVHRSSCQAVLLALCAEGLAVRRDPGPHYRLGPQLLGLGRAAGDAIQLSDVLDTALLQLRDEFHATAFAGSATGDSVVITAAQGVPHPYALTVRPGSHLPLRAPIGPVYVAWAGEDAQTRWLDRAEPRLAASPRHALSAALHDVRSRGWSATVWSGDATDRTAAHEATNADLAAARLHVIGVSAPVWALDGALASSIAVTGLPSDVSGADLRRIAQRVAEVATGVTVTIRGLTARPR